MPLADYQKQMDDAVRDLETPYWMPLSQIARLIEEVGELARAYNHKYGDKVKKASEEPDDIAGEMGDVIFTLICLANSEGINLDEALQRAFIKAQTRDKDRFPKKPL